MQLTTILLPCLTLSLAVASSQPPKTVQLHHRFLPIPLTSPSEPPWIPLGSVSVDAEMSATKLDSPHSTSTQEEGEPKARDDGKGWYQVAVERDGDWVIGSTRACRLATTSIPPPISLHLVNAHITSISLHTPSRRCANGSTYSTVELPSGDALWEINIKRPIRISSPTNTATPPAADPITGLPVVPPPEKSFLQKYWLPMLGITLFLAGQLGGAGAPSPAEGEGRSQQGPAK